jgi:hypothetical protein
MQSNMYPPAPVATTKQNSLMEDMIGGGGSYSGGPSMMSGPMAANSLLGGAFGSMF